MYRWLPIEKGPICSSQTISSTFKPSADGIVVTTTIAATPSAEARMLALGYPQSSLPLKSGQSHGSQAVSNSLIEYIETHTDR